MNIDFSEKTAVVTGGTRGIGKGIVSLLLESKCHVIYTGREKEPASFVKGGTYEQLDMSDIESVNMFVKRVMCNSHIDILVNNAGVNIVEPIDKIQDENWENILAVNLTGPMQMTRAISKVMIDNGSGRILNISSIFGIISKDKRCSYSASKTGLIGLTRACSLDLAPYGILVNALCPGFTLTDMTSSILSESEMNELASQIPIGRFASVEEIAKVAVFLCSNLNTYITGQTVVVDGGMSIQ